MALDFARGSLEWTTGAGGTTFAVSGLSFQPKAIRLWCLGLNSAVDATSDTAGLDISIGLAVSAASRASQAARSDDGSSAVACARGYRTDCLLHLLTSGAGDDGRLDLQSIDSGGFTLVVDIQAVRAQRVFWEAWGGSDITDAAIGEISTPGAIGIQDYVVTGNFQPDVVMFALGNNVSAAPDAVANNYGIGFGAASASGQFICTISDDDGAATGEGTRYSEDSYCVAGWGSAAGPSVSVRASFVQFNADGFRLDYDLASVLGQRHAYLAIKGGQWKVGAYNHDTSVTNNQQAVSLGFQPVGALLATTWFTADTASTFGVLGLGSFKSTTDRGGAGVIDETGTANSEIDHAIGFSVVIPAPNVSGSPPGLLKTVDVIAVGTDGFTMNADLGGSATIDQFGYVAFATAVAPPPTRVRDMIGCGFIPSAR